MTKQEALEMVIPPTFKKHACKTLALVYVEDKQYLEWMYREIDCDKYAALFEALDVLVGE